MPLARTYHPLSGLLWRFLKLLVVVIAVGAGVYWATFSPVRVVSHRVERGEIISEVMGTGTLEARVRATISPKIAGRIDTIHADQGDQVAAGDLLVELDDDDLAEQVEMAEATLATARAALERIRSDKKRAEAVLARAQRQYERSQRLIKDKATSQSELDQAVESLGVAEAGLSRAEAAIAEGSEQIVTAERTLAYHQARLAETRIMAPFAGLIVRRRLDPGDVVVPGSSILSLVSLDELWISAWIDETEMAKLRVGQRGRVVFRSEADKSYPGKVVRLGREADRETREFVVDVDCLRLPNNWAVGQRAEVFIDTARVAATTLLPARLIQRRDNVPGVFCSEADRARWRPLRLGLRNAETVQVIDGVAPGDTVVAPQDPKVQLTDGTRITAS